MSLGDASNASFPPQVYSLRLGTVFLLPGSPSSSTYEPYIARISPWPNESSFPVSLLQNGVRQELRPFDFPSLLRAGEPQKQYVITNQPTGPGETRPVVLLITRDQVVPGLEHIKPSNLVFEPSGNGTWSWQVARNAQSAAIDGFDVVVVPSELPDLFPAGQERSGPITKAQLLAAFNVLYGQLDAGGVETVPMRAYRAFVEGGNTIEDPGDLWSFGNVSVSYLGGTGVRIKVEEDIDPFTAAQCLATGLQDSLRYPSVRNSLPLSTDEDFELYLVSYRDSIKAGAEYAANLARAYLDGIAFFSKPAELVMVVSDIEKLYKQGQWTAGGAMTVLAIAPFVGNVKFTAKVGSEAADAAASTSGAIGAATRAMQNVTTIAAKYNLAKHLPLDTRRLMAKAKAFGPLVLNTKKARQALIAAGKKLPAEGWEAHHGIPKAAEFQEWAMAHGIDINDAEFLSWREPRQHTLWHSGIGERLGGRWNNEWRKIIAEEARRVENLMPEFTRQEIKQKYDDLIEEYERLYP